MYIDYEKDGGIALLTIQRPEVLNALSLDALSELSDKLSDFQDDSKLRVAVVTGAGPKSFCSGMDLKSTLGLPIESLFAEGSFVRGLEIWKPLIAAVNGYAFGGGFEIALACDIRIASDNASFGLTEVSVGLMPGWGGTQRLPLMIPFGRALEMVLMGKRISAEEAFHLHLVSRVVRLEDLMSTAREMAAQICEFDPRAVQSAKEAMVRGRSLSLKDGLSLETSLLTRLAPGPH